MGGGILCHLSGEATSLETVERTGLSKAPVEYLEGRVSLLALGLRSRMLLSLPYLMVLRGDC